jgi:hypothetical protein
MFIKQFFLLTGIRLWHNLQTSRPALGPTQSPIQWVRGRFPRKIIHQGVKLTTQNHLVPKLKINGTTSPLSQVLKVCIGINLATFTHLYPYQEHAL